MSFQAQAGTLFATIIILSQLTMLWKDNVFFRWGTRLVVGYAMMDIVGWGIYYVNRNMVVPMTTKGEWWWIFALIMGILLYFRISREYGWISKYPISLQLGLGIGVAAVATVRAQILDQIRYTVVDIFSAKTAMALFNAIIAAVALVTVISYFIFTREHTGVLAGAAYAGRAFMMASIAVIWAGDYMWAMAILAGVLSFLYNDFFRGLLLGGMRA